MIEVSPHVATLLLSNITVTALLFSLFSTDFALHHNDNLMVSLYLTLYLRHIVAACYCLALLLQTAPQQTLPRSVRSTYVLSTLR
jgi:hypothetical protein